MQDCPSHERNVSPSVRSSDKRVHEERSAHIFTPYERTFILVFWEEEWLVGVTPSTWNFGSNWPRWSEIADFQSMLERLSRNT